MAEEEKKEEKENESKNENNGNGNKLILIIIVILLLLLLVVGGLVAYFLLSGDDTNNNPNNPGEQKQPIKEKPVKKESESLEIGPIYPLDPFTVNLKSVNGSRYLKCTINLEIDSPDTQPELDKIKPAIRDVIIRILSSKTVPEISTSKGKEKLKEELKKNINAILPKGEIKHVYFTAFVIQ
jgi:flagellar FliL protein